MIHIFDLLASQLRALLNGLFENQTVSIVRYLYKRLIFILILAGSPALNSGITLTIFSLSGKIPCSTGISKKYLSGMFSSLKQFLTHENLFHHTLDFGLVLVKKWLFDLVGIVVSTF